MRLPVESPTITPKVELFASESLWIRFSLPPTEMPTSKPRTAPPLIITSAWPARLEMPRSQIGSSRHEPAGTPSPPTVWPFKSSVMLSAPITIPLLGQLVRSLSSFVFVVIVAPQLTLLASAWPLPGTTNAPRASAAHSRPTRSNTSLFIATPFARVPVTPPTLRSRMQERYGAYPAFWLGRALGVARADRGQP